jgi:FixJ family two-component response regulator
MQRETVYIVDDDASVRDALSLLLSLRGHATATFASAEDFLAAAQPQWRGCAVIDIRMPGMDGLALQAEMLRRAMRLPVIVISAHGDIAAARQAFRAQAVDFLEKPFDAQQLIDGIESALASARRGAPMLDDEIPAASSEDSNLTPRERQVMELLVSGEQNRRIAELLGISHRTVEVHKARILEKTRARSVVDLARRIERARSDATR